MAEIAHPYEQTAQATAASRQRRPPAGSRSPSSSTPGRFARRAPAREERYQDLRAAFVRDHGEITDGYICESGPMAVALTAVRPRPLERKLLRYHDRIELYTETERLVRMHPEVAPLLHRAEVQYVSVRNALRGLSQRLLVNWLFVWTRDLMLVSIAADGRHGRSADRGRDQPGRRRSSTGSTSTTSRPRRARRRSSTSAGC